MTDARVKEIMGGIDTIDGGWTHIEDTYALARRVAELEVNRDNWKQAYMREEDRTAHLTRRLEAADRMAEAGDVMSNALKGSYIVPGAARKWDMALTAYRATAQEGK